MIDPKSVDATHLPEPTRRPLTMLVWVLRVATLVLIGLIFSLRAAEPEDTDNPLFPPSLFLLLLALATVPLYLAHRLRLSEERHGGRARRRAVLISSLGLAPLGALAYFLTGVHSLRHSEDGWVYDHYPIGVVAAGVFFGALALAGVFALVWWFWKRLTERESARPPAKSWTPE